MNMLAGATEKPRPVYLALEGGGVLGIGHIGVGRVLHMMAGHYPVDTIVGTSAGAAAGAVLAAGISDERARELTLNFPYGEVVRGGVLQRVPGIELAADGVEIVRRGGMYSGDNLQRAVHAALAQEGIEVFRDFDARVAARVTNAAHLVVAAHDSNPQHGLVLFPRDYAAVYGINEEKRQLVDFAVRASSSIPGFFQPAELTDAAGRRWLLADGGIDALLPHDEAVQLAHENNCSARILNVALGGVGTASAPLDPGDPLFGIKFLVQTVRSAPGGRRDDLLRDPAILKDSIVVDTAGISSTCFSLTREQQLLLYSSGILSASEWVVKDLGARMTAVERGKLGAVLAETQVQLRELARSSVSSSSQLHYPAVMALVQRAHKLDTSLSAGATPPERQVSSVG